MICSKTLMSYKSILILREPGLIGVEGAPLFWEGEKARGREEGEVNTVFRGLSMKSERTVIWSCEKRPANSG